MIFKNKSFYLDMWLAIELEMAEDTKRHDAHACQVLTNLGGWAALPAGVNSLYVS